jgi:hypothetical protein
LHRSIIAIRSKQARRHHRERAGIPAAEGATAPETLRQKDQWAETFWKEALRASADGITISGKQTEGAHFD